LAQKTILAGGEDALGFELLAELANFEVHEGQLGLAGVELAAQRVVGEAEGEERAGEEQGDGDAEGGFHERGIS
jgi:hypothetical protein